MAPGEVLNDVWTQGDLEFVYVQVCMHALVPVFPCPVKLAAFTACALAQVDECPVSMCGCLGDVDECCQSLLTVNFADTNCLDAVAFLLARDLFALLAHVHT